MKKFVALVAIASALTTPAFAQSMYDWNTGKYVQKPAVQVTAPAAGVNTQRGAFTDPDPFIRASIERNYGHYQNLNGG